MATVDSSVLSVLSKNKTMSASELNGNLGSPDKANYPWNWGCMAENVELKSPKSSMRGRPRAEAITSLILHGTTSPSAIKCKICNRVFPREKSLQAHMRTHTGERPYVCDFPGCCRGGRGFAQSGQLKTHQRLHTGEKPFVCSVSGCQSRFAHANRHCPDHPYQGLQRVDDNGSPSGSKTGEQDNQIAEWMEKYHREKEGKSPAKTRGRKLKRELDRQAEIDEMENKKLRLEDVDSDEPDEMIGALALIQLANCRT